MYQTLFSKKEFRTLCLYNILVNLAFAPMNLLFVFRKNEEYGLSDMFVIIFTDVVSETLSSCLVLLPLMILFAKITPKNGGLASGSEYHQLQCRDQCVREWP